MKKIISLLLAALLLSSCCVFAFAGSAEGAVLYVAADGDDSAGGTEASPLATLAGAKEKAKTLSGDVTVYFREGTYTFDSTVSFTSADKSDVTYKAFPGEKAVFTAGTAYTGFEECTVNGVRAFRKAVGTDAGITSLWNGETTLRVTRYPESGYLYPAGTDAADCINPELEGTDNGIFLSYTAMSVNPSDLPALKNADSVKVRILHWWKDEMLPVKSYSRSSGRMEFTKGASMRINTTDRFFLENVFEALNEPGEWYWDSADGLLYYIPEAGESADGLTLYGGSLETLVSINGVDGLTFENIIFRGNGYTVHPYPDSSQAAFNAKSCLSCENSKNFTVKNCEFRDLASCAVFLGAAVTDSRVESCVFKNLGAQAVYICGNNVPADDPGVTKNITVTNNIINGYGKVFYNAVGVLVIHANSVDVTHNEICDGYYTAISVGWVWGYGYTVTYNNRICDNLIYNIGQGWLSDMGGIYTLGNQPGTVLSGNVIHNVAADPDEGGYGGWGIYLDEGSAYILVEKNLAYCCGSDSYHLHYGSYNTVRNNIFALSGESQVRAVSNPARAVAGDGGRKSADFTNNILLTDKKVRTFSAIGTRDSYYEEGNIFWDLSNGDDLYVGMDTNVKKGMNLESAVRKNYIHSPMIFDPGFRDAANYDFELSADSPAAAAGFETWDYQNAGTVKGTTVGLDTEGGTTAYNAGAVSVEMKTTKEPGHFFIMLWNRICAFFEKLFNR